MKKTGSSIPQKIKLHYDAKRYTRIIRQVAEGCTEISRGYIVGYSKHFIVLQEEEDFRALGFSILPVEHITGFRFNSHDQYMDKIMRWEKETGKIGLPHKIDLSSWPAVFKSIKATGLNVIVECEDPAIDTFTIGPVVKTTTKLVYIQHFDASGYIDKSPTSIDFASITKVLFDDRYINVFSKYLRKKGRTKK